MKILIAHHVEPMWKESLKKRGTDLDDIIENIRELFEVENFDRLILTRFEEFELDPESHYPWTHLNTQVETYAYGWDQEMVIDDEHGEYTDGGQHSEYVEIQGWMYDLRGHEVHLCGAFDGECIEDMEIALEHCEVPFKRIEN